MSINVSELARQLACRQGALELSLKALIQSVLRRVGYQIVADPLHDWVVMRAELRRLFSRLGVNCVLDIGANTGDYGRFLRDIGYAGRIVSFEPVSSTFKLLQAAVEHDRCWEVHQFALGAENVSKPINLAHCSDFNSFLRPNQTCRVLFGEKGVLEASEVVCMRRLDGIFADLMAEQPDAHVFLKTDTQGYDLEVIEGATGCLRQVLGLQMELSVVPLYDGLTNQMGPALDRLRELNFGVTNMIPVTRDNALRAIEFDCILTQLGQARH